jgi:hypothetical protein
MEDSTNVMSLDVINHRPGLYKVVTRVHYIIIISLKGKPCLRFDMDMSYARVVLTVRSDDLTRKT